MLACFSFFKLYVCANTSSEMISFFDDGDSFIILTMKSSHLWVMAAIWYSCARRNRKWSTIFPFYLPGWFLFYRRVNNLKQLLHFVSLFTRKGNFFLLFFLKFGRKHLLENGGAQGKHSSVNMEFFTFNHQNDITKFPCLCKISPFTVTFFVRHYRI